MDSPYRNQQQHGMDSHQSFDNTSQGSQPQHGDNSFDPHCPIERTLVQALSQTSYTDVGRYSQAFIPQRPEYSSSQPYSDASSQHPAYGVSHFPLGDNSYSSPGTYQASETASHFPLGDNPFSSPGTYQASETASHFPLGDNPFSSPGTAYGETGFSLQQWSDYPASQQQAGTSDGQPLARSNEGAFLSDLRPPRSDNVLHGFVEALIATQGPGDALKKYDTRSGTSYSVDFKELKLSQQEKNTCYTYLNLRVSDPEAKKNLQDRININYTDKTEGAFLSDWRSPRSNDELHGFMDALIATQETGETLKKYDTRSGTSYSVDFKELKLNQQEKNTCYAYLDQKVFDKKAKKKLRDRINMSYADKTQ